MRTLSYYTLALILAVTLTACGALSETNVTGNWAGKVSVETGENPFTFSLTQNGTGVGGTMSLYTPAGVASGVVNGTVAGKAINLTVQDQETILQFNGTVNGNNMSGSGVVNFRGQTRYFSFTATR